MGCGKNTAGSRDYPCIAASTHKKALDNVNFFQNVFFNYFVCQHYYKEAAKTLAQALHVGGKGTDKVRSGERVTGNLSV